MQVSEYIREANAKEGASNKAQPALKHMNKALDQLSLAVKILHDMREPEMTSLQNQINKVVGDLYKIMVPLSKRSRSAA